MYPIEYKVSGKTIYMQVDKTTVKHPAVGLFHLGCVTMIFGWDGHIVSAIPEWNNSVNAELGSAVQRGRVMFVDAIAHCLKHNIHIKDWKQN